MSEYKIGDLVKVRDDLLTGKQYGNNTFIFDMIDFRGKIIRIFNIVKTVDGIFYLVKGCEYSFSYEMFEGKVSEWERIFYVDS